MPMQGPNRVERPISDPRWSEIVHKHTKSSILIFMVTRQRIIFQGRVQGVGFRARTSMIAAYYAITGWVRNEPDGTVMLEAQGDEETLEKFLNELRKKTSGLVEREIHAHVRTLGNESTFEIVSSFHSKTQW